MSHITGSEHFGCLAGIVIFQCKVQVHVLEHPFCFKLSKAKIFLIAFVHSDTFIFWGKKKVAETPLQEAYKLFF